MAEDPKDSAEEKPSDAPVDGSGELETPAADEGEKSDEAGKEKSE